MLIMHKIERSSTVPSPLTHAPMHVHARKGAGRGREREKKNNEDKKENRKEDREEGWREERHRQRCVGHLEADVD